jgi:hypothetical protein
MVYILCCAQFLSIQVLSCSNGVMVKLPCAAGNRDSITPTLRLLDSKYTVAPTNIGHQSQSTPIIAIGHRVRIKVSLDGLSVRCKSTNRLN